MKEGKFVLITGGAKRVGRSIALAAARSGMDAAIHYRQSQVEAEGLRIEIEALGRQALLLKTDLARPEELSGLIPRILEHGPLLGLVNNASIYENLGWEDSTVEDWNRHLMINLTAPFLLSQAFARALPQGEHGRIINLLDWRAMRPGVDHLPYSISKSALASLTQALAVALAPHISVNGLSLGAVLPPSDGSMDSSILDKVPLGRWASLDEINEAFLFLLHGPKYVTGDVLYIDGGRHLV